MNWVKSVFTTLAERQESIPGALYDIPSYETPGTCLPEIANLALLAELLTKRLTNRNIVIFGDYDVDGIFSMGIMQKSLLFLGRFAEAVSGKPASTVEIMVPDRFQEGYGFSVAHAAKIHKSTILLLDNGIVQYDAILKAKENGNEVFVVDHHEPGDRLPDADVIVNPHAISGGAYDNYCAAGLSYRLARAMFEGKWLDSVVDAAVKAEAMQEFLFMAAIATVADVVPLLWENRVIVREGMKTIPQHWKNICFSLMDSEKPYLNEGDVAFKIAPAINAVGRLGELNKEFVEELMTAENTEQISAQMQYMNHERKQMTKRILKALRLPDPRAKVIVVQDDTITTGIAGIIAGHLAEKHGKPVFVFSKANDGMITGSARAAKGTLHLKNLLDEISAKNPGLLSRYGGHESAAGVTISADKLSVFTESANSLADYKPITERVYDFELGQYDWFDVYDNLQKFAPYGEGNPSPILHFHVTGEENKVTVMAKEHLKIQHGNYEAVGFNMADKANLGCLEYDLYGTLQMNEYRGSCRVQLNIVDFEQPKEEAAPATDFSNALAACFG